MIKRIRLANRKPGISSQEFASAWPDAVGAAATAPTDARPARIAVSTVLPEVLADPRHDAMALEWFADRDHLDRYESWRQGPDGAAAAGRLAEVLDVDASPVVIADDHVMRGADWLEQRWRDGQPKLKHVAIATRADGLTLAQFFELWRTRAGKIGAVPIPEEARGLAYVQNHPHLDGPDWAYDAINEVYFDDVESLRTRIEYFAQNLGAQEDDLVKQGWFLAVREEVLSDR